MVSHFGSTTRGFLEHTPKTRELPARAKKLWEHLYREEVLEDLDFKTYRPMRDISDIEELVARKATACIATSLGVKRELVESGVNSEQIHVIHNAIEDYWFESSPRETLPTQIVFLGRLGNDTFTLRLKGLDRLAEVYAAFPKVKKATICMTTNQKLKAWMRKSFEHQEMFVNLRKDLIPQVLAPRFGSILFIPSRYEGFSLSLAEGMSQGLIPVSYPVGVAPEIIRHGENGFLVNSNTAAIRHMKELLASPKLRERMALSAQETAQRFRSDYIASSLLDLYRKLKWEQKNLRKQNGKQIVDQS